MDSGYTTGDQISETFVLTFQLSTYRKAALWVQISCNAAALAVDI